MSNLYEKTDYCYPASILIRVQWTNIDGCSLNPFSVDLTGNGIYSQKFAEVSRSVEKLQLFAGQSLGGQAHGLWTWAFQAFHF